MPRPCSLCHHPKRQAIDEALAAKTPLRNIAERFETSPAALHRHQSHTPPRAPHAPALPLEASALGATAARLHTAARQRQSQTRDLRSIHQPEVLVRLEDLARVLVEVTGLLVTLTTAG